MESYIEDFDKRRSNGLVRFALAYPYFIVVSCLILLVLGIMSALSLPIDLLPSSNQAAVQILTFYPGMPVENIETNISTRFEIYTGQGFGIVRQESRSLTGVSIVRNYFSPETQLDSAFAQTTSLIMSTLRKLPPGTQPPLVLPFDPMASVPLSLVAVGGDFSEIKLYDQATYQVRPTIQTVIGAIAPTVMGGAERRVVAFLDSKKLEKFNLSPLSVLQHLTASNTFVPTGDVKIGNNDVQIMSNGLVEKIDDMNNIPLRSQNGVEVLMREVGQVKDASAIQTSVVMINGKRQVYIPVYKQPGANSIRVVDSIKLALKKLESKLEGIKLSLVSDQTAFIRHAIRSIIEEGLIGGGFAALMVLLFLGNPLGTGGVLLSLPLSFLCAFIGLRAVGESINAMTLGGLALSVGVLVDNSIVSLENIIKKQSAGAHGSAAALFGASEVIMPVMASTICTLIVLFPVIFLQGVSRTLFLALAKSVSFAMIGSFFCSMTVIPLYSAHVLSKKSTRKEDLFFVLRFAQTFVEKLTEVYGEILKLALRFRYILLAFAFCFLGVGVYLAPHIGSELFPRADAGNLVLKLRMDSGTRIEKAGDFAQSFDKKIREWIPKEDLEMIITNVGLNYGYPAAYTPNSGPQDMFFNIEFTHDRKYTSQYYARIIRQKLKDEFPNLDFGIELGGLLTGAINGGLPAPIDVQVFGPDYKTSHHIASELSKEFKTLKGATDVRVQQRIDNPEIQLTVDRREAGKLGLTVDEVIKNVVSAVSGSFSFLPSIWIDPKSGVDYFFGVEVPESKIASLEDLKNIPITGNTQNRSVNLKEIAKITPNNGYTELNHVDLKRVVDVYMDAQDRDIGGLSRDVKKIISQYSLPNGYSVEVRGEIKQMEDSTASLKNGFLLAVILVYLILVIQFRSFLLPVIILSTVPMGMVGIVLMLLMTNTYFSIQAAIGAIFMIGIAVANGVLLIEFISHRTQEGEPVIDAIINGAKARFRPILMTSLASVLGLVPMAIGFGQGSEANIPLGRAVIGGQLVSTVLTLFIVPSLFRIFYSKGISKPSHSEQVKENILKGTIA